MDLCRATVFQRTTHRIETSEVFPPNIRTAWVAPIHHMMHNADLMRLKLELSHLRHCTNVRGEIAGGASKNWCIGNASAIYGGDIGQ